MLLIIAAEQASLRSGIHLVTCNATVFPLNCRSIKLSALPGKFKYCRQLCVSDAPHITANSVQKSSCLPLLKIICKPESE